jgi:hypothetical protein
MNENLQIPIKSSNYVVARLRDGKMIKGITYNFGPRKRSINVITFDEDEEWEGGKSVEVFFSDLKAFFFVKSLKGSGHPEIPNEVLQEKWDTARATKVKVTFFDGETITGTTPGYTPDRVGFFVLPLNEDSNNIRVFVVLDSVENIEIWR